MHFSSLVNLQNIEKIISQTCITHISILLIHVFIAARSFVLMRNKVEERIESLLSTDCIDFTSTTGCRAASCSHILRCREKYERNVRIREGKLVYFFFCEKHNFTIGPIFGFICCRPF